MEVGVKDDQPTDVNDSHTQSGSTSSLKPWQVPTLQSIPLGKTEGGPFPTDGENLQYRLAS